MEAQGKVMHQRKRHWGRWVLLGLLVVAMGAGGIWYQRYGGPVVSVKVYSVTSGVAQDYIKDTAVLVSNHTAQVSAQIPGILKSVKVKVGDSVAAGAELCSVEVTDYTYQLEALEARRAGLMAYVAELGKPADVNLLEKLAAAEAAAQRHLESLERQLATQVAIGETVPKEQLQALEDSIAIAKANLRAVESDRKLATKGTSVHLLEQARQEVRALEAQIEGLKATIDKGSLRAPISGVVVALPAVAGDFVLQGTPLATIEDLAPEALYLQADLLAEDIVSLQPGAKVLVEPPESSPLEGTVRRIDPKAHIVISDLGVEQRRVKTEIVLTPAASAAEAANAADGAAISALKLGYAYDIRVVLKEASGLLIPESARFKVDGRDAVFVVQEDRIAIQLITVSFEGVDELVVQGLTEGALVVQSPAPSLESDIRVTLDSGK